LIGGVDERGSDTGVAMVVGAGVDAPLDDDEDDGFTASKHTKHRSYEHGIHRLLSLNMVERELYTSPPMAYVKGVVTYHDSRGTAVPHASHQRSTAFDVAVYSNG
jgi:hypothetical protein